MKKSRLLSRLKDYHDITCQDLGSKYNVIWHKFGSYSCSSALIKYLQKQGRLILTNRLGANTVEDYQRTSLAAWQCLQGLLMDET